MLPYRSGALRHNAIIRNALHRCLARLYLVSGQVINQGRSGLGTTLNTLSSDLPHHTKYHVRYIMKTKTQYFILPGHVTLDSTFLIKFDGQYSYWGSRSEKWIRDPTLFKQSWIEDYFTHISERDAQKIIKEGAPQLDYRRKNPKLTIR
jgi:hypothetical protein